MATQKKTVWRALFLIPPAGNHSAGFSFTVALFIATIKHAGRAGALPHTALRIDTQLSASCVTGPILQPLDSNSPFPADPIGA